MLFQEHLSTSLFWDGKTGRAQNGLVTLDLSSFPTAAIPGRHVLGLAYSPYTRVYEIRESGQGWRKMNVKEIKKVERWLAFLVEVNSRILVEGPSTFCWSPKGVSDD